MKQKYGPMAERTLFLAGVTFLGGFLDGYSYITRGGVFVNNHTGNMSKLGIELARGSFNGAMNCFLPILACVFGSVASEWIKHHHTKGGDWRVRALLAETIFLFAVSFVPASVSDSLINIPLSFITGIQLCLFRASRWGAHNTTICTGNLRTLGQFLYGAFHDRTNESWERLFDYGFLVISFVLGSVVGVPICLLAGHWAALAGCLLCAVLTGVLAGDSKESVALC